MSIIHIYYFQSVFQTTYLCLPSLSYIAYIIYRVYEYTIIQGDLCDHFYHDHMVTRIPFRGRSDLLTLNNFHGVPSSMLSNRGSNMLPFRNDSETFYASLLALKMFEAQSILPNYLNVNLRIADDGTI